MKSFTKADLHHTQTANFKLNPISAPMRVLIPAKFGGGSMKGQYIGDYLFVCKDNTYDLYELVAFFNQDARISKYEKTLVSQCTVFDKRLPVVGPNTDTNRMVGLRIGYYEDDVDKLDYPLKLVSPSYTGTYEDCPDRSYEDPYNGESALSWKLYDQYMSYRQVHIDFDALEHA